MRFSTIFLAFAATTFAVSSAVDVELKTAAKVEASELDRALESIDEPKRFLRSNKYAELDDYDEKEERAGNAIKFSKKTFNAWLDDKELAETQLKELVDLNYNVKGVKQLMRVNKNSKYLPLVKKFQRLKKGQGRKT